MGTHDCREAQVSRTAMRLIAVVFAVRISISWNPKQSDHQSEASETSRIEDKLPYTEKSFRNLVKSTRNQIVFSIFRLTCNQKGVRLILNQSEMINTI